MALDLGDKESLVLVGDGVLSLVRMYLTNPSQDKLDLLLLCDFRLPFVFSVTLSEFVDSWSYNLS